LALIFAIFFVFTSAFVAPGAARAEPPSPPTSSNSPGARAILGEEEPAVGSTTPELGEVPDRALLGKPVRRVEVVSATQRWATKVEVSRVRAGEPFTFETARRAMRELLESGRFARATVEAFAEGEGVVLRVHVLPRRIIATIQLSGASLDPAATLEAGDVHEGGELSALDLTQIAGKIRRYYARHGFPSAKVDVDTTDTDAPDRVVLSIGIVAGPPRTVAQRVFEIEPLFDREVGDLKNKYKVGFGDRVDTQALADADRDFAEVLRKAGFLRAEVRHSLRDIDAKSYLYVQIDPGPRLVPAFEGQRSFDAGELEQALELDKVPDARPAELTERVRSFYVKRGFLDAEVSVVEQGKADEAMHYLAFSIRENSQVRVTRRVFPCLASKEFSPEEVGREIGSFLEEDLPGSETFSPVDPRMVMRLFGPTAGGGGRAAPVDLNPLMTYAPESYDRALKHLRDLFYSRGYLNAVVGPLSVLRATCSKRSPPGQCVPELPQEALKAVCAKDSLGIPLPEPAVPDAFSCRPDPAHDVTCAPEVTLRIPIQLGPQMTLYDLAFEGNRSLSAREIARFAELSLGEPLSNTDIEAARQRVLDVYRTRGYAYADVRADVEPSPDRTRARVRFYVTERDLVTVSGFEIKGATRTERSLILGRLSLREGQPYRQNLVRESEERIATLGTFSSVSVGLEDPEVPQRQKRVIVTVVEQLPQYLEPRLGFSTGEGIRFAFEYGNRNVAGLAIALTLRVQLSYLFDFLILDDGVIENYARLDREAPINRLERRNTLSLTFPEIGLGPLVSLTLNGIDVRDNQRDYGITKDAFVPALSYRPFRQLGTQLSLSAEYNDVQIFNEEAKNRTKSFLRTPEGTSVALAQRLNFTLDLRDNPTNATKGGLFATTVEHVNAFPVGEAAKSTSSPTSSTAICPGQGSNQAEAIKSHFMQFTGRVAGYLRLTKQGTTLALSLGAGVNVQLAPCSETYPDRLFFLGGVDTIRSFLAYALVPQDLAEKILRGDRIVVDGKEKVLTIDDIPIRGGDLQINPRVELRIPLNDTFQTGIFLDTGNVWTTPDAVNLLRLRYALGAGLRLGTPIGPVAFDYGINLDRRPWEDFGAFHFSIGLF